MTSFPSLLNSYIVVGEWATPTRKAQKEFAEAAKSTPSMQMKEYETAAIAYDIAVSSIESNI